jgi:large subunit ribosomal protein L17
MRHKKSGRKFNRDGSHRAMRCSGTSRPTWFTHERIETTDAKAQASCRSIAERLITRALRLGDSLTVDVGKLKPEEAKKVIASRVHAQRLVASFLPRTGTVTKSDGTSEEVDLVHKLFHDIAPRFLARVKENKGGGYTRVIKLTERRGDNAPMAIIEILAAN